MFAWLGCAALNGFYLLALYLIVFWVSLFSLYKIFHLKRYGVEFKPYLTVFWKTRKLNNFISMLSRRLSRFWLIFFTVGVFLGVGEFLFAVGFFTDNLFSFYRGGALQPVVPLIPGITISIESLPYFLFSVVLVFIFHEFYPFLLQSLYCSKSWIQLKNEII